MMWDRKVLAMSQEIAKKITYFNLLPDLLAGPRGGSQPALGIPVTFDPVLDLPEDILP